MLLRDEAPTYRSAIRSNSWTTLLGVRAQEQEYTYTRKDQKETQINFQPHVGFYIRTQFFKFVKPSKLLWSFWSLLINVRNDLKYSAIFNFFLITRYFSRCIRVEIKFSSKFCWPFRLIQMKPNAFGLLLWANSYRPDQFIWTRLHCWPLHFLTSFSPLSVA